MKFNRRLSNIKRKRKFGFRARMRSKDGRNIIRRRRRLGRELSK